MHLTFRHRARNKLNHKMSPENAENYKRLKGIAQKTIKKQRTLLGGILWNSKQNIKFIYSMEHGKKNEWN